MVRAQWWCVVAVCAGVVFGQGTSRAHDWPQWRGPNRDGKVVGFTAPKSWPSRLEAKWKVSVGQGDATPALVGGRLYAFTRQGGEEVLSCLSAADGKVVWQAKYAARAVTGPAASHPGPRSSPTVAEGKVVTLGVGGVLSCFDAATGKRLWQITEFTEVPAYFTAMSPLVANGLCVAHLGGRDRGTVLGLDLASGQVKWKWSGDGPAYASPVLANIEGTAQVVVQTEKSLVGLALADGKLLWQVPTPVAGRAVNAVTPVVDGSAVIYSGQGRGTHAVRIEKQDGGFAAKPLWSNEEVGGGFTTPVLKDGVLFGISDRGNLFAMEAQTGKILWRDSARRDRFGAVVDAGQVLVALEGNGQLTVFAPSREGFREIARLQVAEGATYAHPVLDGNRVFIKDRDSLAQFVLPQQ